MLQGSVIDEFVIFITCVTVIVSYYYTGAWTLLYFKLTHDVVRNIDNTIDTWDDDCGQ